MPRPSWGTFAGCGTGGRSCHFPAQPRENDTGIVPLMLFMANPANRGRNVPPLQSITHYGRINLTSQFPVTPFANWVEFPAIQNAAKPSGSFVGLLIRLLPTLRSFTLLWLHSTAGFVAGQIAMARLPWLRHHHRPP